MSYIKENKTAWENAFENRSGDYSKDLIEQLNNHENPFFHNDFLNVIKTYDLKDKTLGQFCCNNGRELLQLSKLGLQKAIGFELAKNMVNYANQIAERLNLPAQFIETDVLEIDADYTNYFDYGLITVGAICWFEDLNILFKKIAQTLKPNGVLFIHEIHPVQLMLATKNEKDYIPSYPKTFVYDYFVKKIWKEHGMGYMTDAKIQQSTFTSFSHKLSDIMQALLENGLELKLFNEFDYCVANLFDDLNHQGLPLSMIIVAKKK